MRTSTPTIVRIAIVPVLVACAGDRQLPLATEAPALHQLDAAEWSEPVNIGAPVNSAANEFNAALSPDGHSLYFNSPNRPGGLGGGDIWVARRDCLGCPWNAPVNLTVINTEFTDATPTISDDGHLLFFSSNRPGGSGDNDIWLSRRNDPRDDFGWETPMNLGPEINSAMADMSPEYLVGGNPGEGNLYFQRGNQPTFGADLYVASVKRDGSVLEPAVIVPELSVAGANDGGPSLRRDGRVLYFWSFGPTRPGISPLSDLWFSTRSHVRDPWSAPQPVGAPISTPDGGTIQPSLSKDGRTLLFISTRPGGLGGQDIWMSTRVDHRDD